MEEAIRRNAETLKREMQKREMRKIANAQSIQYKNNKRELKVIEALNSLFLFLVSILFELYPLSG